MADSEEESTNSENSWPMNEDWLMDILKEDSKSDGKITINHFSVKAICQQRIGNLSDLIMATIKYEVDGNAEEKHMDLIIKLLPQDPFGRYFVTINHFDLREIQFYTKIYADLGEFQTKFMKENSQPIAIDVPKCFYTKYKSGMADETTTDTSSPEPPESILVLQDMRPLGYQSVDLATGLTLGQAEAAIKAIASVHSLSLAMKIKDKTDINEKYPFLFSVPKATETYQRLVEQGFPHLIKFVNGVGGFSDELVALEMIRSKASTIIEKLLQPIEPMGLITHTDFWCNNLLFKETSKTSENENADQKIVECIILDWQMISYSRPSNDLALLIISSLPSSIRRANTHKLLTLYHTTMKLNLEKMSIDIEATLKYTKDKFFDDYKKSQLLALLLCIGSADIAMGKKEAEQRFLDVLRDLYKDGVLNVEELSF